MSTTIIECPDLQAALRAYNVDLFQDSSSYPKPRAQRALGGRTHYVDDSTLRFFGARVLRCLIAYNATHCLIQESLAHPELGRVRRNVLFDVFGTVVGGRETFHKSSKAADREFSELNVYMDGAPAQDALRTALVTLTKRNHMRADEALRLLQASEVAA